MLRNLVFFFLFVFSITAHADKIVCYLRDGTKWQARGSVNKTPNGYYEVNVEGRFFSVPVSKCVAEYF